MKIVTANRLSDGRVIYVGEGGGPVDRLDAAGRYEDEAADGALAGAQNDPATFVNPYLVDVGPAGPSGRDRLKETIRSRGPTVGHSLGRV